MVYKITNIFDMAELPPLDRNTWGSVYNNAKILDESDLGTEIVRIGSKVKLLDRDYNEELEFKILGKSDIDNGIISDLSPVGSAIMNKKVGDIAEVHTPSGNISKMKILSISK